MLRIGGSVRGVLIAHEPCPELSVAHRTATPVGPGVWFVHMTAEWARELDQRAPGVPAQPMVGFELLTAGVITYLEGLSAVYPVGYFERTYGLEVVDCAVAWNDGRISAGPAGTSVTDNSARSALNDVLDALGVVAGDHVTTLTRIADL